MWPGFASRHHTEETTLELLRELSRLQHERGYLSDETLRELSRGRRVPLYVLEGLVSFYPLFRRSPPPSRVVHVCRDVCCAMAGDTSALLDRLNELDDIEVAAVSCLGRCDAAPAASVNDAPIAPATLVELADDFEAVLGAAPPELTARRWKCDPYADPADHFATVRELIGNQQMAAHCIDRLQASRLSGMGGAGFPTGRKWELVAQESSDEKFVICNADESEPGTFKDRVILAELPHLVIEGMILAGLTVGAKQGILYLRHEYTREQTAVEAAIAAAREQGLLGADSVVGFDIEIFVSPGGYILGEETALLEALEDRRGEPRNKPPYPGTHGLRGKPTLINNVETLAFATSIIHHGPDWWRAQGLGDFCGLKFCSISGDVQEPGVHEVPMGTTIADLIERAGGMRDGKALKAFLPGGASSNFLPAKLADTPIDFQAMKQVGSMLGTCAVIVMAEGRDLFSLATNLVRFFRNESCGKCVPCREGSERAVQLLEGVTNGDHDPSQLQVLAGLGETLEQTSICGLGQVALNPVLSMLQHFPDEIPDS